MYGKLTVAVVIPTLFDAPKHLPNLRYDDFGKEYVVYFQ